MANSSVGRTSTSYAVCLTCGGAACSVLLRVPGRVGSVTNSASRGVQNQIVASALDASAGRLDASARSFGRVGGKFCRVSENI